MSWQARVVAAAAAPVPGTQRRTLQGSQQGACRNAAAAATPRRRPAHALCCRLVTLTGVVSPEEQRRELFGDPQADRLTAAGSTSGAPLRGAPPSPPPVEQRLSPVPPSLAAAGAAAYAAGSAGEESEDSKDKDL